MNLEKLRPEEHESHVRSYCRNFPAVFNRASGSYIFDENGAGYLDFLSGCGSLNYGHNHSEIKASLIEYIEAQGIVMSLDLHSCSKRAFLESFTSHILHPRSLDYKIQFPGPTGANAVEAAIKLARKMTGRTNVISFTNGFHGCSLGALSLTGSKYHRKSSAPLLTGGMRAPYDGYFGDSIDTSVYLEKLLSDPSSGYDEPAAIIFETTQGEGGLNAVSPDWAQNIQRIACNCGALLIVDEIQTGCGRTGSFFSFEALGIVPDIVCMAKSLSGFGLPMSLVLMRSELDVWAPGEHNGTFRGNNFAFVTAARAIELFWRDDSFVKEVHDKARLAREMLGDLANRFGLELRGRGLMLGLNFNEGPVAAQIQESCYEHRLILETSGPYDEVLKLLPPLTVSRKELEKALAIISDAVASHFQQLPKKSLA